MKKLYLSVFVTLLASAASVRAAAPSPPDGIVIATMGDTLGPRNPVSTEDPEFAKLIALIKTADVGFANAESNGMSVEVSRLYKAMGIDMMSKANNHSQDGRDQDLLSRAVANLGTAGIVIAGSGMTDAEARAPAFYESRKGRIGLVATASTFQPDAAVPGGNQPARRGISVLRTQRYTLVPAEMVPTLDKIGAVSVWDGDSSFKEGNDIRIGNTIFRESGRLGFTFEMNPDDRAATLDAVRRARASSDLVVFSIHAHETQGGMNDTRPADFLQPLFHDAIDAGADIVVRTGPHEILGIEIYQDKPIFYGMGSIFYGVGINGKRRFGSGMYQFAIEDTWFDSAVAFTKFKNGKMSEIRIYPLTVVMGSGPMASSMRLASGADAQRILTRLREDSAPFGTAIAIENGVGVIRGAKR